MPNYATIVVFGINPVTTGGKLVTFKIKDELEDPILSFRITLIIFWPTQEYWVGANFIILFEIVANDEIDDGESETITGHPSGSIKDGNV